MAEYDGSIRIGTDLDQKGFKAGSKELEAEVRRMAKTVSDGLGDAAKIAVQKQTDAFVKQNQQYAAQEQKVKDIASKLHDLQRTKVETPIFKETSKDLLAAEKKLDSLYGTLRRLEHEEKRDTVPYRNAIVQIDLYKKKVLELQNQLKELEISDKAYVPVDTSKVRQELAAAEQKQMQMYSALQTSMDALVQKETELTNKEENRQQKAIETQAKLEERETQRQAKEEARINAIQAKEEAKRAKEVAAMQAEEQEEERLATIRENAVVGNQRIVEAMERRRELVQEIADMEAAGISKGYRQYDDAKRELAELDKEINDYANGVEKAKESYNRLGQAVKKFGGFVKSSFSRLNKSASKSDGLLGTLASRFKGLALSLLIFNQISKAFNYMMSGIREGIGNIAQVSKPVNAALSSLKSSLTQLKNSFASAFAPILTAVAPALTTLINLASKAVTAIGMLIAALTGQKMFTKATAVQEKYADSLSGTAKSAKDANKQLSSLDKLNNLTSGNTGGGGGGTGGGISAEDMFEDVQIDDRFKDIAQWLKSMWENADFTDLGTVIGAKIKNGLGSIDWGPIKATAQKIGKSIGTLINGFVEVGGLGASIGKTIGEAINTGIAGINAFLDNTHWDSIGIFMGEGLNGIVNTVDWEGLGHLFAAKWNAIFETIGNIATTFDWPSFGLQLATSINTFITDFDWAENGAHLGELIKGVLDSLIALLEETDWQALGKGIADFIGGIDWGGIIERLAEGIGAAFGSFASLLWGLIEEAWNSVVAWWQETAFEDGKFIPEKLFDGILEVLSNIGTWIKEHIAIPFLDGIAKAFGLNADGEELFEIGVNIVSGFLNGIVDMVKSIASWIDEHIFQPFINGFKKVFGIHSPSTVMAEMGKYIMQGLLNGISSFIGPVIDSIKNVWDGIKEVFNGFMTFLTGVFTGDWEKAWDGIVQIFSGVETVIKGIVNGILGVIESLANGVIEGINFVIGALNNLSFDVPDWVPLIGGETFGFDIPELKKVSIPRLATGAVLPANKEFLAVLGDQKHGRNLEAPEDLIRKIVREESGKGVGGEITIKVPLYIDGIEVTEAVVKVDREHFDRTGRPLFSF